MKSSWWLSAAFVLGVAAIAVAQIGGAPAAAPPREVRLLVGDQFLLEPGFAVGDIAVADPKIADYRVRPGRVAILLLGVGSGRTRLILWHQDNKTRDEFNLVVETREEAQAEAKLRALLRDFPSVKVERVGGALVVSGVVSAEDDLALIERMAASAKAESFVRYTPPVGTPALGGALPPPGPRSATAAPPVGTPALGGALPPPGPRSATAAPPGTPGAAALPGAFEIEYEVQVLEASITFGSNSYETGIEPSGRVLYTTKVRTTVGGNVELFVPGKSLASKDIKISPKELETGGIRLTLTPFEFEEQQLSTRILVETNLPIKSPAYVPGGWRRARWESANEITAPFSVAGAELLVVPELLTGGSRLSKISSVGRTLGGLPGVSSIPGGQYAGSVPYYDKNRKTHLLALFRARVVAGR